MKTQLIRLGLLVALALNANQQSFTVRVNGLLVNNVTYVLLIQHN